MTILNAAETIAMLVGLWFVLMLVINLVYQIHQSRQAKRDAWKRANVYRDIFGE